MLRCSGKMLLPRVTSSYPPEVGLSPLTANIYFPAIPTISEVFGRSTELINLTVTVYMIVQGIGSYRPLLPYSLILLQLMTILPRSAPMFWGTLSDRYGRRPMFICCMVILSLSCVGLALVPTDAYWGLMLLRCLQAFGSASTVALGECHRYPSLKARTTRRLT